MVKNIVPKLGETIDSAGIGTFPSKGKFLANVGACVASEVVVNEIRPSLPLIFCCQSCAEAERLEKYKDYSLGFLSYFFINHPSPAGRNI